MRDGCTSEARKHAFEGRTDTGEIRPCVSVTRTHASVTRSRSHEDSWSYRRATSMRLPCFAAAVRASPMPVRASEMGP